MTSLQRKVSEKLLRRKPSAKDIEAQNVPPQLVIEGPVPNVVSHYDERSEMLYDGFEADMKNFTRLSFFKHCALVDYLVAFLSRWYGGDVTFRIETAQYGWLSYRYEDGSMGNPQKASEDQRFEMMGFLQGALKEKTIETCEKMLRILGVEHICEQCRAPF